MGKSLPLRVGGPLAPFARGFLVVLRERGYEWTAVHARMRVMAELSDWIVVRGIDPRQLTQTLVAEFLEGVRVSEWGSRGARRRRSGSWWRTCAMLGFSRRGSPRG